MRTVTLAKGGTKERTVNVSTIVIPDLWHIAMHLKHESPDACEKVLETWHLAHDLLREVAEWECHANADLLEVLRECITENGAIAWKSAENAGRRLEAITLIAKSAIARAEGE